jgi:ABC-type bacteriocin/lantibiotic exporter with double-glycine peptidase domain
VPRTILGYVLRYTGKHQIGLAALSIAVFLLSAVPLELQRRIINDLTEKGRFAAVVWLAAAYAGVALVDQSLKLLLNMYRGWVAESSVRSLRFAVFDTELGSAVAAPSPLDAGVEIAMILEEAEPIGGFTGLALSEPLLQGGILVSVLSYMFVLEPYLALLGVAFIVPQTIFVPLMQQAINRRAQKRILVKRELSGEIADNNQVDTSERSQAGWIQRIFRYNMGIYWLKYAMNLLMNMMQHLAVGVALCVGGWLVLQGRIEVGTVVAVVVGLGKLNDPWGDLVNWFREFSVVRVKYRLYAEAADWLTGRLSPQAEPELAAVARN